MGGRDEAVKEEGISTSTQKSESNASTTKSLSDAMEDVLSLSKETDDKDNAGVDSASYPIPESLSRLLKASILGLNGNGDPLVTLVSGAESRDNDIVAENSEKNKASAVVELEPLEEGLKQLVSNAFHALDAMYFET